MLLAARPSQRSPVSKWARTRPLEEVKRSGDLSHVAPILTESEVDKRQGTQKLASCLGIRLMEIWPVWAPKNALVSTGTTRQNLV